MDLKLKINDFFLELIFQISSFFASMSLIILIFIFILYKISYNNIRLKEKSKVNFTNTSYPLLYVILTANIAALHKDL